MHGHDRPDPHQQFWWAVYRWWFDCGEPFLVFLFVVAVFAAPLLLALLSLLLKAVE